MEGGLGENEYMWLNGWVPLQSTWNYDNIVNWLHFNTKQSFKINNKHAFLLQMKITNFSKYSCLARDLTTKGGVSI